MGLDRNCRQLDCPVPIAHRGRGSAEVDLKATFSYNRHGRASFRVFGSPTTKHERVLGMPTLSYKLPRADLILTLVRPQRR